jgi:hypothetical protein
MAEKMIKWPKVIDKNMIESLSEIYVGKPEGVEESFYIQRLRGINGTYEYLAKREAYHEEQRSINANLKLAFGIVLGMLMSVILPNWTAIHKAIFNL